VTRTLLSASLFLALLCAAPGAGQDEPATAGEAKPDSTQPRAKALPAPKGLKLIDQGGHDRRLAGYRVPEGFKAEVVAEAPAVGHAVAMTFADDGSLYVLDRQPSPGDDGRERVATFKYKDGSTRKFRVPDPKKKDVVKVLTSSKKDGVLDAARVVLEDESASGLLLHDGWLYLAGGGTVRRYRQSKAGGPFDQKVVIAQGFGGAGERQVAGLTVGIDGWLYVTAGEGDHHVEGADGSRATVLRTGAVFRCKPDGSRMHVFAIGFSHPQGDVAFDLGGNFFLADNGPEKGKLAGGRLVNVVERADSGWRLAVGARCCEADPVRACVGGELPGKLAPLVKTDSGKAGGMLLYNESRLPESYRGLLLLPDAGRRVVQAYRVESVGASFRAIEEFSLLAAEKDPDCHPSRLAVGPDGGLYVLDRRGKADGAGGRIYRLNWSGTKDVPALPLRGADSWSRIAGLKDDELIKALSSEDASDRERARKELVKRGDRNRKALVKMVNNDETPLVARISALGALESMFDAEVQTAFEKALRDGDSELQRLAAEALGLYAKKGDRNAHNALLLGLSTEDYGVRRAVALAMGRLAGPGAGDNLAAALSFDRSKDPFLHDGIVRGLEMLGKEGMRSLIALADSGVQKDTDRVVEVFLALRERPGFEALPTILKHMHVTEAQRADLMRSATNYQLDPPVSLEPLVEHAIRQKEGALVKKGLLEALAAAGTVKGENAKEWVAAQLEDSDNDVRREALRALAEVDRATAVKRATALLTGKDAVLQREAVLVLGTTAEGACLAGKAFLEKKLPAGLQAEVAAALRTHASGSKEAARLLAEVTKAK
jgi:putative membrane-bound dehydrogenase-like protein